MTLSIDWLRDQRAIRCILVEADCYSGGSEITRYFSTHGYTTRPTDTPANTAYPALIVGGVQFTESLDLDGRAGLSFGSIELANDNGELDAWLDDVFVNRSIKVYIGDVQWPRADFQLIFDGIIADLSGGGDVLNIEIRDKLQRLNTPVTEETLGGSSINAERLKPVCLGECFNVPAILEDETTHKYRVHDGAIESIIEVRDNGVPVSQTDSLSTGTYTLDQNSYGQITASVQGDKPSTYENTVAGLVERLATGYGKVSERFTAGDIDAANFAAFDAANPQPVGLYMANRTNVLTAIHQLADSVGAQPVMSRAGQLRLLKIELPPAGTPVEIRAADMVPDSLRVEERVPVRSAIKLGYCRNWTIQQNLQTGIPDEHKAFFNEEWLTVSANDATVAATYKLDNEPEQKDTLLLRTTDATAECSRLLDLYKTPRTIFSFEGFETLLNLELGEPVTLYHNRFGMAAGKTGMVVRLAIDWLTFRVTVGVIV